MNYSIDCEFNPVFDQIQSVEEAADIINRPHEDYPRRSNDTAIAINQLSSLLELGVHNGNKVSNIHLYTVHNIIFSDVHFRGRWRTVDVVVSDYKPPMASLVPSLMSDLEKMEITSLEALRAWYKDFECIHPFQDGNGRVGGVVYTVFAKFLFNIMEAPIQ